MFIYFPGSVPCGSNCFFFPGDWWENYGITAFYYLYITLGYCNLLWISLDILMSNLRYRCVWKWVEPPPSSGREYDDSPADGMGYPMFRQTHKTSSKFRYIYIMYTYIYIHSLTMDWAWPQGVNDGEWLSNMSFPLKKESLISRPDCPG
jgi:hypothetical protein